MASDLRGLQSVAVSAGKERWVLFATVLVSGMAFIDSTALNVALPALQDDLNATGSELLWILNGYSLLVAALLLVGGALGDRYGRRRIYVVGIAIFSGASLACGIATTATALIAARVIQGIGGALMIPGSLAIIVSTVSSEHRGRAIGTWSALSVVATAIGPVLGGILASAGMWRYVFFINLPMAAIAVAVLYLKVPESRSTDAPGGIDYRGAALLIAGLMGVNYGLVESASSGFSEPRVLVSVIGGAIALLVFVYVEALSDCPFLPLRIFKVRTFNAAAILTLSFYSSLYGMLFFFSLNLIQVQGYTAKVAGMTQLPLMVLVVALSRWAGGLVDRFGPRLPLIIGAAVGGLGFLLFALPGVTNGPAEFWGHYLPPLVALGVAMGMTVAPLSSTVMSSVADDKSGLASGINSALSRLASVLGIAVLGSIALFSYGQSLEERTTDLDLPPDAFMAVREQTANLGNGEVPPGLSPGAASQVQRAYKLAFVDAFRTVSCVCAGVVWLSMLLVFFLMDPRRLTSSSPPRTAANAGAQFLERTAHWHRDEAPDKTPQPP